MIGLLYSYLFVGGVLGLSLLFSRFQWVSDEGARKFIHVLVIHWYLLAMFWFDSAFYAAFVPLTFILLNYLSFRYNLVKPMERKSHNIEDLGTVYYAVSLTIITFVAFYYDYAMIGLFALLVMGYADAFAAMVGKQWPTITLYAQKSLSGSLIFLSITAVLGFFIIYDVVGLHLLWIAPLATLIELFSKKGLDNLSVPLLLFFLLVVMV